MTGLHDTVTVYSYSWTESTSRRDRPSHSNVNPQDARLAALLVQSCQAPARTSYRAEPWKLEDPLILPAQGNKLYETTPPHAIKPITLSRPPSRDRTGLQSDVPFRHWEPTASVLEPSLSTTSSPPDPVHTPCIPIDKNQRPVEPLRSILRTRSTTKRGRVASTADPSSRTSVGAIRSSQAPDKIERFATDEAARGSAESPLKRKKTVRVESPRTSDARQVEAARNSTARAPSMPAAGSAARSSISSPRRAAITTTSSTPRPMSAGDEAGPGSSSKRGTSLAVGAIQRCIPPPYAHPVLDPLLYPDQVWQTAPDRTQCILIRHSFVDSDPLAVGEGQVKPTEAMRPYLERPRRGAWLVPLSGRLPIEHTSSATWTRAVMDRDPAPDRPDQRPIEWTDARLSALWAFLTKLHEQKSFGYVRAQAIPASGFSRPSRQRARTKDPGTTRTASDDAPMPDVIKINCDAHLALPIRTLLAQLNVPAARRFGAAEMRKDASGASVRDSEKYLMGRALLWIDEEGRPIMTA